MSATCRSCGARIVWAKTPAGKAIPLDPTPVLDGNIVLSGTSQALIANVYGSNDLSPIGHSHYKSHFATCPNAAKHRKPKEPRR